jgi:hypothetical protein
MMNMDDPSDGSLSRNGGVDIAAAVAEFHKAFGLPVRDVPSGEVDCHLALTRENVTRIRTLLRSMGFSSHGSITDGGTALFPGLFTRLPA